MVHNQDIKVHVSESEFSCSAEKQKNYIVHRKHFQMDLVQDFFGTKTSLSGTSASSVVQQQEGGLCGVCAATS